MIVNLKKTNDNKYYINGVELINKDDVDFGEKTYNVILNELNTPLHIKKEWEPDHKIIIDLYDVFIPVDNCLHISDLLDNDIGSNCFFECNPVGIFNNNTNRLLLNETSCIIKTQLEKINIFLRSMDYNSKIEWLVSQTQNHPLKEILPILKVLISDNFNCSLFKFVDSFITTKLCGFIKGSYQSDKIDYENIRLLLDIQILEIKNDWNETKNDKESITSVLFYILHKKMFCILYDVLQFPENVECLKEIFKKECTEETLLNLIIYSKTDPNALFILKKLWNEKYIITAELLDCNMNADFEGKLEDKYVMQTENKLYTFLIKNFHGVNYDNVKDIVLNIMKDSGAPLTSEYNAIKYWIEITSVDVSNE